LKPWQKKIDAILRMQEPKNIHELRSFLGAVGYYHDMYPHRAHILAPLTSLTKHTGKLPWNPKCTLAFKQMKALLAEEALLAFPDHSQPFHVYTDASDYQLGAVIMQNNKPVAYYSRKLTPAQMNYTVMEKELLSIVETLKAYRSMLYGCKELYVYTDHKNLTFTKLNSRRVLRWRLLLEDYAPIFKYIQGTHNKIADSLSRLGISPHSSMEEQSQYLSEFFAIEIDAPELLECLLYHPNVMEEQGNMPFDMFSTMQCPLTFENIREQQMQDPLLLNKNQKQPDLYKWISFGSVDLLCICPPNTTVYRICIPSTMLEPLIEWYHYTLGHVGETRLKQTMLTHLYHPDLNNKVIKHVQKCGDCKQFKLVGKGYGHLPPRNAKLLPWEEVACDSIGPWTITAGGRQYKFKALTTIDTVSNLCELIRLDRADSTEAGNKFEHSWLFRYPKPERCIHDNGPEFGFGFLNKLETWGIKDVPTTSRNPQANSICERLHQTIGNIIRAYVHTHPCRTYSEAASLVDKALGIAQHAVRSTIHTTMRVSPGALVFHRDMLLNLPLVANLITIRDRRQSLIDDNLRRQNNKRIFHDYKIGDWVSLIVPNPAKLDPRTVNRFQITQVHVNGTVTIQRSPTVTERINIRRLKPCS
jgi:RNase H-like domain found in reverse transcriptase/Integrase zinc binding domain